MRSINASYQSNRPYKPSPSSPKQQSTLIRSSLSKQSKEGHDLKETGRYSLLINTYEESQLPISLIRFTKLEKSHHGQTSENSKHGNLPELSNLQRHRLLFSLVENVEKIKKDIESILLEPFQALGIYGSYFNEKGQVKLPQGDPTLLAQEAILKDSQKILKSTGLLINSNGLILLPDGQLFSGCIIESSTEPTTSKAFSGTDKDILMKMRAYDKLLENNEVWVTFCLRGKIIPKKI